LSGRSALSLPKPAYPGNEEGIVVVSVTVDKYGKVTNAEAGVQGTNTYNTALIKAAKEAALKARFNADPNAAAFQKGTITYRFVLD
jgi:TonB family protein